MTKVPTSINEVFSQLQPVVLLGGQLFALTRRDPGVGTLRTAAGTRCPLRTLGPWRVWMERARQPILLTWRDRVQAACALLNIQAGDGLGWVVCQLLPLLERHDLGDQVRLPSVRTTCQPSPNLLGDVQEPVPELNLPEPNFGLGGRLWQLTPASRRPRCLQIDMQGETYGLTGQYTTVPMIEERWREQVQAAARQSAMKHLATARNIDPAARAAQLEVAARGYFQRGSLLYLPGNPSRLGHVLPDHYNRVLQSKSNGDLAITVPLTLPLHAAGLTMVKRESQGWRAFSPPHGICLGTLTAAPLADPNLRVFAYLRAAAVRLAANGRFHSSDD
jgi:hypothetical protein